MSDVVINRMIVIGKMYMDWLLSAIPIQVIDGCLLLWVLLFECISPLPSKKNAQIGK